MVAAGCGGSSPTAPQGNDNGIPDGWRLESTAEALTGVCGSSATALDVAGHFFTLRYDGTNWWAYSTGSNSILTGMWGASVDNVFATLNDGTILHFDGHHWGPSKAATQLLSHIWGSSSSDVYAVGNGGTAFHYDGAQWMPIDTGVGWDFGEIWGLGPDQVYLLQYRARIDKTASSCLYYNGTTWKQFTPISNLGLRAVWGESSNRIWMIDNIGQLYLGSGSGFSDIYNPRDEPIDFLTGLSNEDLFGWNDVDTIVSVLGSSPGTTPARAINNMWSAPWDVVYGVGNGGLIVQTSGMGWSVLRQPRAAYSLQTIFGSSSSNIFALGSKGVHFDGNSWTDVTLPAGANPIDGTTISDSLAVVVGYGGSIDMWNGQQWTAPDSHTSDAIYGVYAASNTDIFAAGFRGLILHYDGSNWSTMLPSAPVSSFTAIDGSGGDDVFASGYVGKIYHYDGTSWNEMETPTSNALYDLQVLSSTEAYAVGEAGTFLHYDGSKWTLLDGPTMNDLIHVWAKDASHVYAMTGKAELFRYDGNSWSDYTRLPGPYMHDLWGSADGRLFAAGEATTVVSVPMR